MLLEESDMNVYSRLRNNTLAVVQLVVQLFAPSLHRSIV
jgi:hypothetical protein